MTLTNEQIETLKKLDWQNDIADTFFCFGHKDDDDFFEELTDKKIKCLRDLLGGDDTVNSFCWELSYRKHSETYFDLHYAIWCKGDITKDEVIQTFDSDILGLFSAGQTTKDKTDYFSLSNSDILEDLKNNHEDLYSYIIEDYITNLTVDKVEGESLFDSLWNDISAKAIENAEAEDLNAALKDDVGRAWAEDNLDEIKDIYIDHADISDLRDMVCDIIHNYL